MNFNDYAVEGQMSIFDLDLPCGKMFPEHSAVTAEKISEWCLKNSQGSRNGQYQFLCLKRESGEQQERLSVTDGPLRGERLMRNITEFPNVDVESSLSQILQTNVPEKYYLSSAACLGILRRARKRGKQLPRILEQALVEQAIGERKKYGEKEISHTIEVLRMLWSEIGAESFTEWVRRTALLVQQEKILLCAVCKQDERQEKGTEIHEQSENKQTESEENCSFCTVCGLWKSGLYGNTSQGREPSEQLKRELDSIVQKMSLCTTPKESLVLCLRRAGEGIPSMLEALSDVSEIQEEWQGIAGDSSESIRGTSEGNSLTPYTLQIRSGCEGGGKGALIQTDKSACLTAAQTQTLFQPISIENHPNDSRIKIREDGTVQSLTSRMGTGGGNVPLVAEPKCYTIDEKMANTYISENQANTLAARDYKMPQAVCYQENVGALCARDFKGVGSQYVDEDKCIVEKGIKYIVRRLTPTECARLQGMPDLWCRLSQIDDMSDEDYEFWKQAHKTYAEINGKTYKEKTKDQMIKWYNKLQSDAPEYKAYGNGMAYPCVRVPIHGIAQHGAKTMASLFDGIGGFPLAGLADGIQTLWTSEIELFPIAVTKERFGEYEKYGYFTFGNNTLKGD